MLEEFQHYILRLENAVLLGNETVVNLMIALEFQHKIIVLLAICNFIQPVIVLFLSYWGDILDFYDSYKEKKQNKKGGKNGKD